VFNGARIGENCIYEIRVLRDRTSNNKQSLLNFSNGNTPILLNMHILAIICLSLLALVQSLPQNEGWDVAIGHDRVRKSPSPSILKAIPPGSHLRNPRHRPTCDLALDDSQVCGEGKACVIDPFTIASRDVHAPKMGICTPSEGSNMCGGLLGARRKCTNAVMGWRCAEPSRCRKENVSDCDFLCVQPPPSSAFE